jgi:hypothetical protein
MSGNHPASARNQVPFGKVQVRAADPADRDAHANLVDARLGVREFSGD